MKYARQTWTRWSVRSQFADNVEVTAQDKILTLSTCIAGEDHHRFLVEAVLTDEK